MPESEARPTGILMPEDADGEDDRGEAEVLRFGVVDFLLDDEADTA